MIDFDHLLQGNSCVIKSQDQVIYTSGAFGVKPLMLFYKDNGSTYRDLTVIDRIMGKGAVMLAVLVGAKELITPIMSQPAYDYAVSHNLKIQVGKIVPMIINRTKDGQCPIEAAVLDINDLNEGYIAISETIKVLMQTSP